MIVVKEVPISYAAIASEMVSVSTHSNSHFPNTNILDFSFLFLFPTLANKCDIIF